MTGLLAIAWTAWAVEDATARSVLKRVAQPYVLPGSTGTALLLGATAVCGAAACIIGLALWKRHESAWRAAVAFEAIQGFVSLVLTGSPYALSNGGRVGDFHAAGVVVSLVMLAILFGPQTQHEARPWHQAYSFRQQRGGIVLLTLLGIVLAGLLVFLWGGIGSFHLGATHHELGASQSYNDPPVTIQQAAKVQWKVWMTQGQVDGCLHLVGEAATPSCGDASRGMSWDLPAGSYYMVWTCVGPAKCVWDDSYQAIYS
ncbi:MAG: hypothetical protein ACYDDF_09155 [Thermoplasmatota archaeon]